MKAIESIENCNQIAADLQSSEAPNYKIDRTEIIRISMVATGALLCWLHLPYSNIAGIIITLIGGYPIFKEALANLQQRRMTMELSMSIALLAALSISETFTALVITFFVLVAEVLEHLTVSRGRTAIHHLLALLPQQAFIRTASTIEERPLSSVKTGDTIVIKPGAHVPVDGTVISGHTFIDQSAITGESIPSEKTAGSTVYAGTINQAGTIDVITTGIGAATAFGKIIHAVENAEQFQAPVQRLADKFGYLVYFALVSALFTFLLTHNWTATISVIIVAGACGIAAGTPLAILGAVGLSAKAGAIIKGGLYVELLSTIDTVVFDKTGTLTYGTPQVVSVIPLSGASEADVILAAATAESLSEHPLGKAIVRLSEDKHLKIDYPSSFHYSPGLGIICSVNDSKILIGNRSFLEKNGYQTESLPAITGESTEVLVAKSGILIGIINIADMLRSESKELIATLKDMGIKSILLTGDTSAIAKNIAQKIGIDEIASSMVPQEKQDYITDLVESGRRVAMVGDGINDAPALMAASVGIAIGSGTDVARESADIVLIGNNLIRLIDTIRIARRCRSIIMANFIGTLAVDSIGILLAACGFLSPLLAAFIHVSSELAFILNSARLLPVVSHKRHTAKYE